MKLRYMGDFSLCNQADCTRKDTCWRFQALVRLGEDQDKDVPKPYRVTIQMFDPKTCEEFILDEWEE
jgi:hypothetical protein